jgi:hypothetical protein
VIGSIRRLGAVLQRKGAQHDRRLDLSHNETLTKGLEPKAGFSLTFRNERATLTSELAQGEQRESMHLLKSVDRGFGLGLRIAVPFAAIVAGCGADGTDAAEGDRRVASVPQALTDDKGRRWRMVRKITEFAPDDGDANIESRERPQGVGTRKSVESMSSVEELAEALRPVAMANGYEYELEEPDYEVARRVLELRELERRGEAVTFPAHRGIEDGSGDTAKYIVGADNRNYQYNNTAYPRRTTMLLNGNGDKPITPSKACSGALIGPSTMITAAHCLHSTSNWYSTRYWTAGADSGDTVHFPYNPWTSYPNTNPSNPMVWQCYWATIPGCWIGSDDEDFDNACDYAVIEFANGYPNCNLQPGNVLGWLGWGSQTDTDIAGAEHFKYGYPGGSGSCGSPGTCAGGSCGFPRIWGHGQGPGSISKWSASYPWRLHVTMDGNPGHSGSGPYNYVEGFPKVIGIFEGCYQSAFQTTNRARRINSTVISFIQANSAL